MTYLWLVIGSGVLALALLGGGELPAGLAPAHLGREPAAPAASQRDLREPSRLAVETVDPMYTGPIFLVHEHVGALTPQELERVIALWEREGVTKAFVFVGADKLPLWRRYRGKLFLSNHDYTRMDVADFAAYLRRVFQQDPLWAGVGELGGGFVVDGVRQGTRAGEGRLPADHPGLLPVYDVAAEFDKVVMIHPLHQRGADKDPLAWPVTQALEKAFNHNPRTVFLVHNTIREALLDAYMGEITYDAWYSWFATLFARYPNLFLDVSVLMTPHMNFDPEFFVGQERGRRESVDHIDEVVWRRTADWFLTHMADEAHVRWHIELAVHDWEPLFRAYPDRFMVGVDSDYREPGRFPWHGNHEAIRIWLRFYRAVLGRLPPEVAEQIAYGNAERVIAGRSR